MDDRKLCTKCTQTHAEYICVRCGGCETCCQCDGTPEHYHRLSREGYQMRRAAQLKARAER